jgi:hypothetical protein
MTDESPAGEPGWVGQPAPGTPPPVPGYPGPPAFPPPPSQSGPQYYPAPPSQSGPQYHPATGAPFGYPPMNGQHPPPPSRSHRGWWITAIVVGAVVVLGVLGLIAIAVNNNTTDSATAGRTFTTPAAFAGHTLDQRLSAAAKAKLPQFLDALPSSFRDETTGTEVAIYGQDGASSQYVTFLGVEWSQSKKHYQASFIKGVLNGAGSSDSRSFDPGPLGGQLTCGTGKTGLPTCAWADSSTGAVVFDQTATSLDEAAANTRSLRAAGEH